MQGMLARCLLLLMPSNVWLMAVRTYLDWGIPFRELAAWWWSFQAAIRNWEPPEVYQVEAPNPDRHPVNPKIDTFRSILHVLKCIRGNQRNQRCVTFGVSSSPWGPHSSTTREGKTPLGPSGKSWPSHQPSSTPSSWMPTRRRMASMSPSKKLNSSSDVAS